MICATVDQPGTFAHQASLRLLELYPELGAALAHLPSPNALWSALDERQANVIIVPEQTTALGWDEVHRRVAAPTSELYVQAGVSVPYACTLLANPGIRMEQLTMVCGDATLWLCGDWLDTNLSGLPRIVVGTSLTDAAKDILDSDDTMALVAPAAIGEQIGLVALARYIDSGATCNWWAISKSPMFAPQPDRLLISARFGDTGELGDLVAALWEFRFRLTTASSQITARVPAEHDYLLAFVGEGRLVDVISELHRYAEVRLLAAYEQRP